MSKDGETYLTFDFILALVIRLAFGFVFTMLTATTAVYAIEYYGVSEFLAGIAAGIFVVSMAVARILLSRYTDIIGRKKMMVASAALFFLCSALYHLPVSFPVFVLIRVFHGACAGIVNNTDIVIGTSCIPPSKYGEGLGVFALGATVANALGPSAGLLLLQNFGSTAMFLACVVSSAVMLVLSALIKPNEFPLDKDRIADFKHLSFSSSFEAKAVPYGILILLGNACYMGAASFMSLYMSQWGIGWFAPWFFIIYSCFLCLFRPLSGRWYDEHGQKAVIYPAYIAFAIAMLLFAMRVDIISTFAFSLLLAFGYGSLMPIFQAALAKCISPDRLSIGLSTLYVLSDIGLGIGPSVAGLLAMLFGLGNLYPIGAILVLLSILLYRLFSAR